MAFKNIHSAPMMSAPCSQEVFNFPLGTTHHRIRVCSYVYMHAQHLCMVCAIMCVYVCVNFVHMCMCACVRTCVCTCECVCVCMWICVCASLHACECAF